VAFSVDRHVHPYAGRVSFVQGHDHRMVGSTGPAVHLADGLHYHLMRGRTSYDHGHTHGYATRTRLAPSGMRHG
jgi:hypothetical protein